MNPTEKLDLDALLQRWPAPPRDEQAWEDRAEMIMSAALKAAGSSEPTSALFEAPPLAAEQGEPQASIASAGEKKMSQESDPTAPKPEPIPASVAPSTTSPARSSDRKRGSLKEMAARASQAGAASRPGPASTATPTPSVRASATSSPLPVSSAASAPSRPKEAGKEDSGIVNLASIKSAATAEEKAAAEKAKPATAGLLDEDDEKKPADAKVVPIAAAKAAGDASKKKGSSGVVVGGVIAILGLAAAFAITKVNKPAQPPPAPVAAEVKQAAPDQKVEAAPAAATNAPVAQASAEPAPSALPSSEPSKVASSTQSGSPGAGAPAPGGAAPAEPASDKTDTATAAKTPSAPAADTTSKPGDLKGAMAQAVGSDGSSKTAATSDNAEPASGPRNQNIPEKPPQGSVQAAIRSVIGDAKACVAGADDISHANVTFSSNGSVSSVSVSGWAASHSQTGCIKNAMKGAKVGPFSSSSFSVAVPIRP